MFRVISTLAITSSALTCALFITMPAEPENADAKWQDVTPNGVDLVNPLACDNYGSITMAADPVRPSNLFTQFHCQGVWKSIDYGRTWFGPINTGHGGAGANGAGGLAIARGPNGQPPILYSAGIRGTGLDGPMRKGRRFLATWTGTCPGSDTLLGNEKCTVSTTTNRYSIQRESKTSQFESVRFISIANSSIER